MKIPASKTLIKIPTTVGLNKQSLKKTVLFLKDPSNALFVSGTLIIMVFVLMSVLSRDEQSLLVEASNNSGSPFAKRDYEGTVWNKFYVTVPEADVFKAEVTTNVDSNVTEAYLPILEKSLAHYQGSAYPGQVGNVFIYGHSILPQFFNPKVYKSMFSHLYKVEVGDKISIEWGNEKFDYVVVDRRVVDPDDLKAINFNRNSKVLSIMTCDPPGTYFKRLIVEAEQVGESRLNFN